MYSDNILIGKCLSHVLDFRTLQYINKNSYHNERDHLSNITFNCSIIGILECYPFQITL